MRLSFLSIPTLALLLAFPFLARAQWTSSYDHVNTSGNFNNFETFTPNMILVSNGVWQHYATITNTPTFQFLFATADFAETWKENGQTDFDTPIAGIAESTGNDIVVNNATPRTFRFTLDEDTSVFSVKDVSLPAVPVNLWINEFDYDNDGSDVTEWIELVGPAGTSLNDYELVMIKNDGTTNSIFDLAAAAFTFADDTNGYGFFTLGLIQPSLGIPPDYTPVGWTSNELLNTEGNTILLRLKVGAINVHSVSYDDNPSFVEDQVTPKDNTTSSNRTIRLTGGPGYEFGQFTWEAVTGTSTPGAVNPNQALVGEPIGPASSVSIANAKTLPSLPSSTDTANLQATVTATNGASNLVVTAFHRIGTSGAFSPIPMTAAGNIYTTVSAIPSQPLSTVVQYYFFVSFDGYGTQSPTLFPAAGPTAPLQYTVPTVQPGDVWLNELNYNPDPYNPGVDTNEYLELAGVAGTDIGNWRIELLNTAGPYASYDIPAVTLLANETNGFGFWVLGDSDVVAADAFLTTLISGTQHLAKRGAIRLRDQFDQLHFEYSYGDPPPTTAFPDAIYIGFEDDFFAFTDESLALGGTGSNYFDLAWTTNSALTPGAANLTQSLVGGNTNAADPVIQCPDDVVVQCVADVPLVDTNSVLASAGCGNGQVVVTHVGDTSNGGLGCFNDPLVISRTYRAVSDCSTTSECIQTITVEDITPPTIECVQTALVNPSFESSSFLGWEAPNAGNISIAQDDPFGGAFHAAIGWVPPYHLDDVSANDLDGTYGAGVAAYQAEGAHPNTGPAVSFSGTGTGATVAANPELNGLTSELTVAAWIRPDVVSGTQWIISQLNNTGISLGLIGDDLRFSTIFVKAYNMPTSIPTGVWTHVACTMDAGYDVTFYTNGVSLGTIGGNAPALEAIENITLAGRGNTSQFDGSIDDLQIYRLALTSNEVFSLVQNPGSTVAGPAGLDPTSLTGLRLWLDATDPSTLSVANAMVSQWRDKSGSNRHVGQSNTTNQPLLVHAASPSRPTVRFDGIDDYLGRGDALGFGGSPAMTVFIIGESDVADATRTLSLGSASAANSRYISFGVDSSVRYGNGDLVFASDPLTGGFQVQTWKREAGASYQEVQMWLDGVEATATSTNVGTGTLNIDNKSTVIGGSRAAGSAYTNFFTGEISEVIIYDRALNQAERDFVVQYIQDKYLTPELVAHFPMDDIEPGPISLTQDVPAAPGQDWIAEVRAQSAASDPIIRSVRAHLELSFLDAAGEVFQTIASATVNSSSPAGFYEALFASSTAPAGTESARIGLVVSRGARTDGTVYFDEAELTSLRFTSGITMECGAVAPDLATTRVSASDNCGSPTLTQNPSVGELLPAGETAVEFIATDCGGLASTCTVMVTVLDTTDPIVQCPTDPVVLIDEISLTGPLPDLVPDATISDACTPFGSLLIVQTPPASTIVSNDTLVELVATDSAGNSATCSVLVVASTVSTTPPTVEILDVSLTGSGGQVTSLGTNTWSFIVEYSTNLMDGPTGWTTLNNVTNSYLNGTNTTTFGVSNAPTTFYRTRQTNP